MRWMSELAAWFHPTSRTGRTRLAMIGAVLGALVLLTTSALFAWPVSGLSSSRPDPNLAFDAPDGSCLTWSADNVMNKVDCTAQHLFEIAGSADITAKYPISAGFPTAAQWQQISQDYCAPIATTFLAGKLNPTGKYSPGALKPNEQQWAAGKRTLRCGLQAVGPGGKVLPTTGSAKTADQSAVYDVGTCLGINGKAVSDPVPCSQAHAYEIVGIIDVSILAQGKYPDEKTQNDLLYPACVKAASDYTRNFDLTKNGLTVTWDTLKQASWDVGSHRVNCKVGAKLPDGSGLQTVTNSVKGVGKPMQTQSQTPVNSTPMDSH